MINMIDKKTATILLIVNGGDCYNIDCYCGSNCPVSLECTPEGECKDIKSFAIEKFLELYGSKEDLMEILL